ncbi:hypothetical protein HDV62DRAFT_201146 [Trichoderma sp. SZMC 28011]
MRSRANKEALHGCLGAASGALPELISVLGAPQSRPVPLTCCQPTCQGTPSPRYLRPHLTQVFSASAHPSSY